MVRGIALIIFAIPDDLALPTGGYGYARRILAEWDRAGVAARVLALPNSFPHPSKADLIETARLLDSEGPLLIDGLAYGTFSPDLAAKIGPRSVVLLHHPLCDEQGLSASDRKAMEETERAALEHAAGVVVTSPLTARDLVARFGVPEDKLTIAIPGTEPAPAAPLAGEPPRLLAVGSVTPRKGYPTLIEALHACADLPWHCDIHGALTHHDEAVARLTNDIEAHGLSQRITVHGNSSDAQIEDAYCGADLFLAPSLHEGYGMAVVEAMAHGLPVITTTGGALPETAPCAVHCPPADAAAFAVALRPLLQDRSARAELGATCRRFAQGLPGWDQTAHRVAQALTVLD